ncbi:prepilin peptidase, partial [Fervidibacter sp.]
MPHWFIVLFAFLFGAAVGSFVNVCIYRLPRRLSIVQPPSHCPHCGSFLTIVGL